jgi:hypothetical protein
MAGNEDRGWHFDPGRMPRQLFAAFLRFGAKRRCRTVTIVTMTTTVFSTTQRIEEQYA